MRRIPFPAAVLVAGLAVLLTGCAGETPTSGSTPPPPPGTCTVSIAMLSTSQSPLVGTEVVVRAAVTKGGVAVADGTSVQITTDLGVFAENGLPTVSKTTVGGAADVTLYSVNPGPAHVKASFECGTGATTVTYSGSPSQGPFISSFTPQSGSCIGGDTITINGGLFGTAVGSVFFGGAQGSVVTWANNVITVKTPFRNLKNASVPEVVDLVVVAAAGQTPAVKFTYFCIGPNDKLSIASMSPTAGSPSGGDQVVFLGSHFGTNSAATQVTFCGLPAQITGQTDTQLTVTTPAHTLANPALSEACPVVITRDLGLPTVQSATSPVPFTYRGSGATGTCNTDPTFYVSSLTPNTGPPDGGTVISFTGGGFPTNPALLKVDFGGNLGTVVGTPTSTTFQVSSPRRVLAQADVPETVDIVVTDLGSATQRCYKISGAYVYTAQALTPTIYSVSPRTGPNDQSTRTSIFGTGFQFPEQVFMSGGACGNQRVEAALLAPVSGTQIIFATPIAVGGNSCLAGQLVDVVVLNPGTGKTATCTACFKYYSCPNAGVASPSIGPATASTSVVITGNNFSEPVIANFRGGNAFAPLQITSFSNTSIIVTMPPLQSITGGALSCANVDGTIELTFPGLACSSGPVAVPFTYRADPPTLTNASPTSLNQDGTPFPGPTGGTPAIITVTGGNFAAPMTVQIIKDGSPVPNTPVNNANVSNPGSLTFSAPAVPNSSLNQQNCISGGAITGVKNVPTSFGIRVKNTLTGCTVDLPNVLVYNPTDTTCRAALSILPLSLTNGKVATAYSQTFTASGGAGAPFTYALAGGTFPPGAPAFALNSTTGTLTGTPTVAGSYTFTIQATDAIASPATRTYSLVIDP